MVILRASEANNAFEEEDDFDERNLEEDISDWEDVDELYSLADYAPTLPERLTITVTKPMPKKRRPGQWLITLIRLRINRMRRNDHLNAHRVSLLVHMGHLRYLHRMCTNPMVQALIISAVDVCRWPSPPPTTPVQINNQLYGTLVKLFDIDLDSQSTTTFFMLDLVQTLQSRRIQSSIMLAMIVFVLLNYFRCSARLCCAVRPVKLKPDNLIGVNDKLPRHVPPEDYSIDKDEIKQLFYWVEVFDDNRNHWIGVKLGDYVQPPTISYVLAIDRQAKLADITHYYASDWISADIAKRRLVDDRWWADTLALFAPTPDTAEAKADHLALTQLSSNVEMPTTYKAFRFHPMFVLERDIHLAEAIYPPDTPSLGVFRGCQIYPRKFLHRLKSENNWFRSARVLKPDQVAYKTIVVKSGQERKLYGHWQTMAYDPPEAEEGVVPRNEFGNVEVYCEGLLPKGTCHLRIRGLEKVARKLNIDVAPAVVGFLSRGQGRGVRPWHNGVVVCIENRDRLLRAWHKRLDNIQIAEKHDRAWRNWKRIVLGAIYRQKLLVKYGPEAFKD